MAAFAVYMTLPMVESALPEDLVDKIARTVHTLRVDSIHEEMAMELLFFKSRTPTDGLKNMFPNLSVYVHTLDNIDDLFDSLCVMNRVVIYKLTNTDMIVLSEFTNCLYHAAYYKINHDTKHITLIKAKAYIKDSGYSASDADASIDFISDALNVYDYIFTKQPNAENKWLLGGAMINWFMGAKDADILA